MTSGILVLALVGFALLGYSRFSALGSASTFTPEPATPTQASATPTTPPTDTAVPTVTVTPTLLPVNLPGIGGADKIAVTANHDVYIMDVDGSNQINLTNNPREADSFPAWSADGQIIFTRYGCLMVMAADGTDLQRITSSLSCIGTDSGMFPDWFQPYEED